MKYLYFFYVFIFALIITSTQQPIGKWQKYLEGKNVEQIYPLLQITKGEAPANLIITLINFR